MKKSKEKTLRCVKRGPSLLQGIAREKEEKYLLQKLSFNNKTVEADKCHLLSLCKSFMSPSQFLNMYWLLIN